MCDNHRPVPCRQLHFLMVEDTYPLGETNMIRFSHGRSGQVVTGHTDGMGCPACGSFEPNKAPAQ